MKHTFNTETTKASNVINPQSLTAVAINTKVNQILKFHSKPNPDVN